MATVSAWTAKRRQRKAEAAEVIKANAAEAKAKLKAYRDAARAGVSLEEPVEAAAEPVQEPVVPVAPVGTQDGHTEDQGQGSTPAPGSTED